MIWTIINLYYIVWMLTTASNQYKIVLDVLTLVLSGAVLLIRIHQPLFSNRLMKITYIFGEVGRFWAALTVVLMKTFGVSATVLSLIVEALLFVFLACLYLNLLDWNTRRLLFQGIKKIQSSYHFEIYLAEMYRLIAEDAKNRSIQLQGILQTHV